MQKSPENYIILPGKDHGGYSYPDILVAKSLSFHGIDWYWAHNSLVQNGARMLNLREFVDFLQLLKSGGPVYDGSGVLVSKSDVRAVYDEVVERKDPWSGEWLDARFELVNDVLHVAYGHRIVNGKLTWQVTPRFSEPLEDCLTESCYIDLSRCNRQGLPTKKVRRKEFFYRPPWDGGVAVFDAASNGAILDCDRNPRIQDTALGVREARAKN